MLLEEILITFMVLWSFCCLLHKIELIPCAHNFASVKDLPVQSAKCLLFTAFGINMLSMDVGWSKNGYSNICYETCKRDKTYLRKLCCITSMRDKNTAYYVLDFFSHQGPGERRLCFTGFL